MPVNLAPRISVVTAVYNESKILPELHRRLKSVLESMNASYEIVLVDDRSRDDSWSCIEALTAVDKNVKGIRLARNFGQHNALSAGLDASRGDFVVLMDADLQDEPEQIPGLLQKCEQEGKDIVYVVRESRKESGLKTLGGKMFFLIFNSCSEFKLRSDVGIYRMLSRKVVDELIHLREQSRMITGLTEWMGFQADFISAPRPARISGKTNYTLIKMVRLAMDGLLSFSNIPLRLAMVLGLAASAASFLLAIVFIVRKLWFGWGVVGWPSLMVAVLFMGGVQLTVIGILGEYIGRIFIEVKRRPLYIIDKRTQ